MNRNFAFIEFDSLDDAVYAREKLHGTDFMGCDLAVEFCAGYVAVYFFCTENFVQLKIQAFPSSCTYNQKNATTILTHTQTHLQMVTPIYKNPKRGRLFFFKLFVAYK